MMRLLKNIKNLSLLEIALMLFVFLLPWQTRYVFRIGELEGGLWEYGTLSVYATEVLLWVIFIISLGLAARKDVVSRPSVAAAPPISASLVPPSAGHRARSACDRLFLAASPRSIILFLAFVFLSIFWSSDKLLAARSALTLAEGLGLFLVLRFLSFDKTKIIWAFVAGVTVQAVLAIYQFVFQMTFASKWLGMALHLPGSLGTSVIETAGERWLRAYGALPHPNVLAGFLVVGIFLLFFLNLKFKNKSEKLQFKFPNLLHVTCFMLLVTALFFTFSRAAWLALIIGMLFLIFNSKFTRSSDRVPCRMTGQIPKLLLTTCYILLMTALFWPLISSRISGQGRLETKSTVERVSYVQESFEIIKQNPILGVGIGNYTLALQKNKPGLESWKYQPVHNMFLLILAELGFFGFLLFAAFLFYLLKFQITSTKSQTNSKLQIPNFILYTLYFVLLFLGLFDHFFWSLYPGVMLFWLTLGLLSCNLE